MSRALLGFALGALGFLCAACSMPAAPDDWVAIEVRAARVDLAPDRPEIISAGALTFMGGVELTSDATRFGGLSGLYVDPSGAVLAVSDAGAWLAGNLVLDGANRLVGFENARIASMRGADGAPFRTKRDGDAEDIAPMLDGRIAVSFEQDHRILIYDILQQGPSAAPAVGPALGGREAMGANEGLEGLATLSDGRLVGMAEYAPGDGGAPFWVLDPASATPTQPAGSTIMPPGFGAVGLTRAPSGDLLRLERFYLPLIGVRLQIRLIPAAAIAGGAPRFDGSLIATLEPPMALDNFESIAAVANSDGSTRIYLLSDDNFSSNQRTLLYAFDYAQPRAVAGIGGAAAAPQEPAGGAPSSPAFAAAAPPASEAAATAAAAAVGVKAGVKSSPAAKSDSPAPPLREASRQSPRPRPRPQPAPAQPNPEPAAPEPPPPAAGPQP